MESNSFSQVIGGLQEATQRLNMALSLPPEFRQIRNSLVKQLTTAINRMMDRQIDIRLFLQESFPKLQWAKTELNKPGADVSLTQNSIENTYLQAWNLENSIRALLLDATPVQQKISEFMGMIAQQNPQSLAYNVLGPMRIDGLHAAKCIEESNLYLASARFAIVEIADDLEKAHKLENNHTSAREAYLQTAIGKFERIMT